jgi:hypothetical protein
MPVFSFSSVTSTRKNNTTPAIKILKSKVVGVVFIDLEGNYYINVDGNKHPINISNYSCIGKDPVYAKAPYIDNKRLSIYKGRKDKNSKDLSYGYLPFAPGCIVTGNIIANALFQETFDIKKVTRDRNYPLTKEAYLFWINNWDTICKNNEELNIEDDYDN